MNGEQLLEQYTKVWQKFQFSSTVVNGIFAYLNRHWIKREVDEGKTDVYEVYNVNQFIFLFFNSANGKVMGITTSSAFAFYVYLYF